jgi:hypothetical protein
MGLYNTFGTYDSAITVEVKSMEQVIKLLALWACAMCAQLVLAQQTQQSPIDERYFADKVYPVWKRQNAGCAITITAYPRQPAFAFRRLRPKRKLSRFLA